MHSKEYWKLSTAMHALNVLSVEKVLSLFGFNQKQVCAKLRNKARAVRKKRIDGNNLTKECFLDIMNDENFEVIDWEIKLKKPGILESGWNYSIVAYELSYGGNVRIKCSYPFKCNTTLDCEYASICRSPLSEIQKKVKPIGHIPENASLLYWVDNSARKIKNINGTLTFVKHD